MTSKENLIILMIESLIADHRVQYHLTPETDAAAYVDGMIDAYTNVKKLIMAREEDVLITEINV